MVALSRNNVGGVYQHVPVAPACPQPDLLASVVRRLDGCRVDGIMLSAAAQGDLLPVVPAMEAVNRNARRPKKVSGERVFILSQLNACCSRVTTAVDYAYK